MDKQQRVDYRAGVPSIDVPTQVIAGSLDRPSPPEHVKSGYDDLGASRKRFIIAGEISGYREDYSHIDLIYGKRAPDEIFPLVSDWFRRHPLPDREGTPGGLERKVPQESFVPRAFVTVTSSTRGKNP